MHVGRKINNKKVTEAQNDWLTFAVHSKKGLKGMCCKRLERDIPQTCSFQLLLLESKNN